MDNTKESGQFEEKSGFVMLYLLSCERSNWDQLRITNLQSKVILHRL